MRRVGTVGITVAALATLVAACSTPVTPARDAATADAPVDAGPPRTLTFVIDQLTIDPTDSPDVPHTGFNLDGLFSTDVDPGGCTHPDYFSLYDNDQHCASVTNEHCTGAVGCAMGDPGCMGGVDNQFPTLANTIQTAANFDLRASLQADVTENRLLLVVRVTGVDDFTTDDAVRVAIYRGYPTFSADCSGVIAGRAYAIDRAYVLAGSTDIDSGALSTFDGRIRAGRLQPIGEGLSHSIDFPLSLRGVTLQLPLHEFRLRANVASSSLSNGSLGGWVAAADTLRPCFGLGCDQVQRGVLGGLVDIQVSMICDGSALTPPRYGGISLGMGFHAVTAQIDPVTPIVDGPMPGTCGADAGVDAGRD
jgi:hypothetical protein